MMSKGQVKKLSRLYWRHCCAAKDRGKEPLTPKQFAQSCSTNKKHPAHKCALAWLRENEAQVLHEQQESGE